MTTSTATSSALVRAPVTSLSCLGCGAVIEVEQGQRTATCIYCMTPGVVEKPASSTAPDPTFVMPFVVAKDAAVAAMNQWKKTRSIFAKSSIKSATITGMRGVYVPAYLYSCVATSSYSAEIGEDYQETETYQTTENGKSVTRTRTVTKTEWRSLSGTHARYVTDVVVTASKGVPNRELERVEPFDMRALRKMDESVLPGWIAEEPSLLLAECLELARKEALDEVGESLKKFMPGDHQRGLTWQTWFDREGAELVLVPVWVLAVKYEEGKAAIRVLINGQTGKAGGDAPLSPLKIALAVIAGVLVVGGIATAWYGRQHRWW